MFNPGWEKAIECAHMDLRPGGIIAVVDFHDTPFPQFRRWMRFNHVRMNGHLLPTLMTGFKRRLTEIRRAYSGWWTYLLFIGEKKENA
jgi:S-adenosylmethionine-diacylgycerolhomoserine-N-methlytransferase